MKSIFDFVVPISEHISLKDTDFTIENGVLKKYTGMASVVEVPEGVICFAEGAFEGSTANKVICPSTLKRISKFCFANSALHDIVLNFSLEVIEDFAFLNCDSLSAVDFPITLKVIGMKAFSNTAIRKVRLPSSVLYVASNAFEATPFEDYVKLQIKKLYYIDLISK